MLSALTRLTWLLRPMYWRDVSAPDPPPLFTYPEDGLTDDDGGDYLMTHDLTVFLTQD